MKKYLPIVIVSCLLLILGGCSEDRVTEPTGDQSLITDDAQTEALAAELIEMAGWEFDKSHQNRLRRGRRHHLFPSLVRESLTDDVAHYTLEVRVGNGANDVIRVHRVVRESAPYRPAGTDHNVFLVHGDGAGFVPAFLMNTLTGALPAAQAMPIFLAENGIDVWGIDFAWVQVPAGTADLSFMADWGLQKDLDDLRLALGIARFTRLLTGCGGDKMNLMGWSRGGMTGYAYVNEESQRPAALRHVGGYIPTEIWFKTQNYLAAECAYAADLQGMLDSGQYADDTGDFLAWMVDLARTDPDGVSPVFGEPFTNLTAILAFGSQTFLISPTPENYHIMAGTFDADGMPTGFQYADTEVWLDFVSNWAPYEPVRMEMETEWAVCGDPAHPVPFDDHLADVTVPVFYLGANGGFGSEGLYTLSLLGSTDVSHHIVTINGDPFTDFAHADLFDADIAQSEVWEPLLGWLETH